MNKLFFSWSLFWLVACTATQETPPSVIIIMADDQGWGDLSYHGNQTIATPYIDAIAQEGLVFDNFYVSPVCSPTRAEVLTGRYHFRSGIYGTSAGGERLNLEESTIAEAFQQAGYATGLFGKWHSGTQGPYHPNNRGFDEFMGFCSGHWGHYFNPILEHNGVLAREEGYIADIFTDKTLDFIDKQGKQPFFIWLAFNTPHSPMQVPDAYWDDLELDSMQQLEVVRDTLHTKAALTMVKNLDDNVGRILHMLKDKELEDNTIVVYLTDNGPNGFRYNGGMKGIKGSTDEGGTRSPFFIRWKNHLEHRVVKENGAAIDLFPTLAGLTGIEPVTNLPFDGMDLLDGSPELAQRMLVQHWNGRVGVRSGEYRLSQDGGLYRIAEDRQQLEPLDTNGVIFNRLAAYRDSLINAVEWPTKGQDDRPFPVGAQHTFLPARDAVLKGEVIRSNRYPNSSYITNWTSVFDTISWDTEILEEGRYELFLHYTSPPSGVGSRLKIQVGEDFLEVVIREAHDPPEYGMEADRVQRIESYVKDFKSLSVGSMYLKPDKNPLFLTTSGVEGPKGVDVAMVELRKINL